MNEFTAWMQSNWYALGSLLIKMGFLAAGVWFARKALRTIRAFQEQIGALLKLSVTGTLGERHSPSAEPGRSFAEASPYWLTPAEIPPVGAPKLTESGPSRWMVVWHGVIVWLKTPMRSGDTAVWRKAIRWLQAPVGS